VIRVTSGDSAMVARTNGIAGSRPAARKYAIVCSDFHKRTFWPRFCAPFSASYFQ
jgi:hypothetical protein